MKNPVDKFETPTGVEVRGQTVRITFMLGGIRRREIVSKIVDKKSIKYAETKRTVVLLEIEENVSIMKCISQIHPIWQS
jgi:hypothetical protein